MRNWSTDTSKFDKSTPEFIRWKLEQLINFGLHGEKIDIILLKKHFKSLSIDPAKRTFLQYLLLNAKTNKNLDKNSVVIS